MLLLALALIAPSAEASEANTHFSVLVPANNDNNGRDSTMVVTAHAPGTEVSVIDTDEDGDSDDSTQVVLSKGQSLVVRLRDGSVNDDAGGKWDGDRFIVDSSQPVTVMLQTRSDWQHDWVPAENGTMRGQNFYVHGTRNDWDFDVVAYEDDTLVEVYRITTSAKLDSGTTSIELPGDLLARETLQRGQDLYSVLGGAGNDLSASGHSYRIITSKPSTAVYGALNRNARDGGGYVPSEDGTTVGQHFYFPAIAEAWAPHEKEIRVVAGSAASSVSLQGWSSGEGWFPISEVALEPYAHADFAGVSSSDVREAELFEVTATNNVNVFYANWLESGAVGTSDVYSFVSALDSVGASDVGRQFVAYLGPPGHEFRVSGVEGTFSHLFAGASTDDTTVTVRDVDTNGELFAGTYVLSERDEVLDIRIDTETYAALNRPTEGIRPYLRVEADKPISLAMNNWNDNWMAFASGVLPRALEVAVVPPDTLRCGVTEDFAVGLSNIGAIPVNDVGLQVESVGVGVVDTQPDGISVLLPGDTTSRVVGFRVPCEEATTGLLAGLSVTATGLTEDLSIVANSNTSASPVHVPEGVGVFDLSAQTDNCAVELSWATEEDGNVDYVVTRQPVDGSEPFGEIGRVPSRGVAASGYIYGFRDSTAAQLGRFRYKVSALNEGLVLAEAGPAVGSPGLPYSEPPADSGHLGYDFEFSGSIVSDALDVVDAPGYDIRQVAVAYDSVEDKLYLGMSAEGIFGDGDGDGDPDSGEGDRARFSVDEGFAIALDIDLDESPDALVGVPFGSNLDLLTVGLVNEAIGMDSPTLAFAPLPTNLEGSVTVDLLNEPSDGAPDLELVVHNASELNGGVPFDELGVATYVVGLGIENGLDRAPDSGFSRFGGDELRAEGCGDPLSQIHMGSFAAFGNIFTGTPNFDFVPFGWRHGDTGELLAEAPPAAPGQVISSPIAFLREGPVHLEGLLDPDSFTHPDALVEVADYGVLRNGEFVHVSELSHSFGESADGDRYENHDLQVFRMFSLDCSATVNIRQLGTSGPLLDDRQVSLLQGGVGSLENMNPALVLAHSGIGTFRRGGDMARLHFGVPEDWTELTGPSVSPGFTQYAFLDDLSYYNVASPPEDPYIYPLGSEGRELDAGIWFINHYLWTYANSGTTTIETTFTPGPDCGGSL